MHSLPRDRRLDSTLAFLSEGYTFVPSRCARLQSDIFETRLMLRKAICMTGEEAAGVFYHPGRFTRQGALPPTALLLLQDRLSVQQTDGADHRHRKQLFMPLLEPANTRTLANITAEHWYARLPAWEQADRIVFHDEIQEILCAAVCRWAGVPLSGPEVPQRTREFAAMVSGAAAVGPRNWRGMLLRMRTEHWARRVIAAARANRSGGGESMVHRIALYRDRNGKLLDVPTAAVELINVLRPTVAVAWFVTFAALALKEHPEYRHQLQAGDDQDRERFVQEVRRYYPFFPLVGGRVRQAFDWRGHRFEDGTWMLLDLYGTNHDPRSWEKPDLFRPERFKYATPSRFNLIPQGGGDYARDHRCPGEAITIELMKAAVRILTNIIEYNVPPQDLRINLRRMPALPASRFVISDVRRTQPPVLIPAPAVP